MPRETEKPTTIPPLSPDRLWAEQLAMGMAGSVGLLVFMALFHPKMLEGGAAVLGPNYLKVYGWASVVGIVLQIVVHEAGTLLVAWWLGLALRFRFFGFGAHATAILENQPRRVWTDAVVGLAGPVTGTLVSLALAGVYLLTNDPEGTQILPPLFLGIACVGYFYNLFTLIPILDLEGGWIAPAIAPQAWFFGLVAVALDLTRQFNLVLVCVLAFGLPRLVLLITARAPRLDLPLTGRQRLIVALVYFLLLVGLGELGMMTFQEMPNLVRDVMGD